MVERPTVGARGEATIRLADRDVTVLFTNRAMIEAERQMGRSVLSIVQGFSEGNVGFTEISQLALVGMQAARRDAREGGPPIKPDDAIAVMDEAGFSAVAAAVMEAVAAVLGYDRDAEDDADPNA